MNRKYILAIDLGTTNCKTLLVNENLQIQNKISIEYPVSTLMPGWSEQNPEDWWDVVKKTIQLITKDIPSGSVKAVGVSGQMHGLVILDKNKSPLRPAILWNDQRSAPQCDSIYEQVGGKEGLLKFTNNPMLPGYTGGKILWVKDHEPEIYRQISHVILPKDYICFRLTNEITTDVSDASGTGLFNIRERQWSYELIEKLHLPVEWFPHAYESSEIIGRIQSSIAANLGLETNTPVIAGGGDAVMQTIGSGATSSDTALIVIGTGGNVTVSTKKIVDNPGAKLQIFCHVLPEQWVAMGVMMSAGSSLKWFRDTLAGIEIQIAKDLDVNPYEILDDIAQKSPPGSQGLIFLPYLQGERCPHTNPNARGAFIGLRTNSRKSDVVRSIMEGVTFGLKDVLEVLINLGMSPKDIHTSGGGSVSSLWRQIQADIFNREVTTLDFGADASALGAGIIAGYSVSIWPSVAEAVSRIKKVHSETPINKNVQKYNELFKIYKDLYPRLESIYEQLVNLS